MPDSSLHSCKPSNATGYKLVPDSWIVTDRRNGMDYPNWGGSRRQALLAAADYLDKPIQTLAIRRIDQW